MHGSSCRLPKDVCGCSSTMRKLACVGKRGKEVYPTRHQAWSFDVVSGLEKPYGILAWGDVQCFRDHVGKKESSAKGLSRTVQLNTLASRETSSAQRQSMSSSAFSRSLDSGRLRDERHNFHITFAASKYYHSNDISVTERVNIDKIESQTNWTARFQSA